MRKLVVVGFVACLIAIDILAASTLFFRELYVQKQSESERLKNQINNLQENKNSLLLEVNSLQNNITGLQSLSNELQMTNQLLILENEDLLVQCENLSDDLETLEAKRTQLETDIAKLQIQCETLNETYLSLTNDYEVLEAKYSDLQISYNFLNEDYVELFWDYTMLFWAVDEPLEYKIVPSIYELNLWLQQDQTDSVTYTNPDFVCTQFAIMLSIHARIEHYDMGVVYIWAYDSEGEIYAHAVNAIYTIEGLVYITAQTDGIWSKIGYEELGLGPEYFFGKWIDIYEIEIPISY